jgi:broad specificity phosphatase PhoE
MRHAPTPWNDRDKMQSDTDVPLNNEGLRIARSYLHPLGNQQFDLVVTSPLLRAKQTGEVIARARNLPLVVAQGLGERVFGPQLEGTDVQPSRQARHRFLVDQTVNPYGIETDDSLKERAMPEIMNMIHVFTGLRVLLINHSSMMRFFVKELGGRTYQDMYDMPINNGSMIRIFGDGRQIAASSTPMTLNS